MCVNIFEKQHNAQTGPAVTVSNVAPSLLGNVPCRSFGASQPWSTLQAILAKNNNTITTGTHIIALH